MKKWPAHIDRENKERQQTVAEHLRNVGRLASEYASKAGLAYCGMLAGLLHDIGKMTEGFMKYMERLLEDSDYRGRGGDHSTAGAVYVMELLGDSPKQEERLTAQLVAMAVMWHHGGLKDVYDWKDSSEYLRRLKKISEEEYRKSYEKIKEEFHKDFPPEEINEIFSKGCDEVKELVGKLGAGCRQGREGLFMLSAAARFLFSCLVDADRYDTAAFMDERTVRPQRDNAPLWDMLSDELEEKYRLFDGSSRINRMRRELSENCLKNSQKPPGTYSLDCPTGSGKTLSSLRYALNHGKKYGKARIFYIAPFISIIEQNSGIIKKFLENEGKGIDPESFVLELHSAVQAEDPDRGGDDGEREEREGDLLAERMDYPIVITTMVRFLNTFFKGGTRNPRAIHNFANSVIIFDEVQSVPLKCVAMFNCVVNFLVEICGATVVLSTATQPVLSISHKEEPAIRPEKGLELSGCTEEMRKEFKRVRFVTSMIKEGSKDTSSIEEVCGAVRKQMKSGKNVLCVFNTKRSAEDFYENLKNVRGDCYEGYTVYYLSTNLCPEHRSDRMAEIKKKLEKGERVVVISTQLIEAGVDMSFHVVFRALAGLDSIIQAAGRCNRNGEEPEGTVYIFIPDFEDLKNLQYIRDGKTASMYILRDFEDYDLDSKAAIESYFRRLFEMKKEELLYPFEGAECGIKYMYDILCGNKGGALGKQEVEKSWLPMLCPYFGTAGKYFEAIETAGISALVPYKKGRDIIEMLASENIHEKKAELLKRAQRYCVNIMVYNERQIEEFAYYREDAGIYILREGYYDEDVKGFSRDQKLDILTF